MTDENTLLLSAAVELGEKILECGGSVNRVEDTIRRICAGYGADRTDVFAITSSIVVTMERGGESVTQTRRITGGGTDFTRLETLNDLSRHVCAERPPVAELRSRIREADRTGERKLFVLTGYILAAVAFALFFGGTVMDAVCSGGIAVIIWLMERYLRKIWNNGLLHSLVSSMLAGMAALLCGRLGLCSHTDIVMIGDIMLLIPGIALTNALHDLFSGDTISGLLRLMEALLLAGMIAVGFALAVVLEGVIA